MLEPFEVERRAAEVRRLLLDCDGVLTDGRITPVVDGDELKSFHTHDGHGLVMLHRAGLRSGIIWGRPPVLVEARPADRGSTSVRKGALEKLPISEALLSRADVGPAEVAYVGD